MRIERIDNVSTRASGGVVGWKIVEIKKSQT